MKSMMKKTLSVIIALAMILVPMSVFAATGDYDEPYQLSTSSVRFYVAVEPEATVWIQADDCNNSTVEVGYATGTEYFLQYGRQSVYPNDDGTASLTLMGYDMFSVYNYGTETIYVYMSLTGGAGLPAGTWDNPEEIELSDPWGWGSLSAYVSTALDAGNQGYYYTVTAPDDGALIFAIDAFDDEWNAVGWLYNINNVSAGVYGDTYFSDDEEPVTAQIINVTAGDVVEVFITTYDPENMWNAPAGNVSVNVEFAAPGSAMLPETLVPGDYSTYTTGSAYFYEYTATEAGVATVTMNDADGWFYCIQVEPASGDYGDWYYGDNHYSYDVPVVPTESVEVVAGDIVLVAISTSAWGEAGTVNWTFDFEAGATLGGEGDDNEGGDDVGGGDDIGGGEEEEELNYADYTGTYLDLGENMYVVDGSYQYTVYSFEPTEEGKYTFTSDDSVMGIVSYNGMWISIEPSADSVNANTFSWECNSVGQSIWVAVMANTNIATIEITKEDLEAEEEVEWVVYENVTTPENFTFDGDAADLLYVDTLEDDVVDTAVLGDDGYYHLNTVDGPILYVDIMGSLDDTLLSASAAYSYGQLTAVFQDENLVVVSKTDYNEAFAEYAACADAETGLYPLTADLMEIYKNVGAAKGWYGDAGVVGGTEDDAWMFACYYLEAVEDSGNEGGDNSGDDNTGNVADPEIPDTGAEVAGVAIAMMATAAALGATVVTTKKSKRVK